MAQFLQGFPMGGVMAQQLVGIQGAYTNHREADTDMFGVFVGDLPQDANEQDLIKLFTTGNLPVVKCKIIRDMDNNSKRYGFVHFPTEELRQKAIIEMHGATLKGQTINVRTQHYKETDRCLVKTGTKKTDIYIGNIPRTLSKYQVREAVADWGLPKVQDVKVFKNDTGMFCFISFLSEQEVQQIMEDLKNNPKTLAGRELLVQSSGTSITSTLNAELLQRLPRNEEEQHIIRSLQLLKNALGGDSCPLNDRQLGLLEKSQRTLYVRNLHPNTNESALSQKFNKYGKLRKVIIVTDKDTKVPMGYGFVEFYSVHACSRAALDDECELDGQLLTLQVSRPPKDIHAIITAAGLTDASGNLLGPYTTQALNQTGAQYFQDPTTGQLFIGDGAHYANYIAGGYAPVSVDLGFNNLYPPTMMGGGAMMIPQDSLTPSEVATMPQVQSMLNPALLQQTLMQQNPLALQQSLLQQNQLALSPQDQLLQQQILANPALQQQILANPALQQQLFAQQMQQQQFQQTHIKQEGEVQPQQQQLQQQQQQLQQLQQQQQQATQNQQQIPMVKSEPFAGNVKTEMTGEATTSPQSTPQSPNQQQPGMQPMQLQPQQPGIQPMQLQPQPQQIMRQAPPNPSAQMQLQQQQMQQQLMQQQQMQQMQLQQQLQKFQSTQPSLQAPSVQSPPPQQQQLQQSALQQNLQLQMQQMQQQQNAFNLQQQNALQLQQQQLNLQAPLTQTTALPQVAQQTHGLMYPGYTQRFAPY